MVSKPYKILLYNNGKRIKVMDRIATYNESVKVFNQILEANVCFFPKEYKLNILNLDNLKLFF